MIYGYARVSTTDQVLHPQTDALTAYGCTKIIEEKVSALKQRPYLKQLLDELRAGDTLVVWKLSCLGRSLKDLITLVSQVEAKKVQFISLQDHLDTGTAQGRRVFRFFASLAEFERDLVRERTGAGLEDAQARGRQFGRPVGLDEEGLKKAQAAKMLYMANELNGAEIGKMLGVSRATVYRYLTLMGVKHGKVEPTPARLVRHV